MLKHSISNLIRFPGDVSPKEGPFERTLKKNATSFYFNGTEAGREGYGSLSCFTSFQQRQKLNSISIACFRDMGENGEVEIDASPFQAIERDVVSTITT